MGLEVRRAISLHERSLLSEDQLFNHLIDLAIGVDIERVMTRVPAGYLGRFRDWLDRQPPTETLIELRSGPVSREDRDAIVAIREWLNRHVGGESANGAAIVTRGTIPAIEDDIAGAPASRRSTRPVGS